MIAQTLVEYGLLQSIAAAFAAAYNRVELFVTSESTWYFLPLGFLIVIVLIWTRRRAN